LLGFEIQLVGYPENTKRSKKSPALAMAKGRVGCPLELGRDRGAPQVPPLRFAPVGMTRRRQLFAIDLRSASLSDDGFVGGFEIQLVGYAENTKGSKKSQALGMTKRRVSVSSRNWFEGSQVSKARPGAPIGFTLRYCRGQKL
jgi:hypothetical protein